MHDSVTRVLWIAAAGALGSVLRYLLAGAVQGNNILFPLGTLAVNAIGCWAMGFLGVWLAESVAPPHFRTAILVGLLGGFTTFSAFTFETLKLAEQGQFALAAVNVLASLMICLVGAWGGQAAAQWLIGL